MSKIPQQPSRQRSKLPQPPGNLAGAKRIAEKMLPGPPELTKPVVEVPEWRWTANWSGERSWRICSVMAMLLVILFAIAGRGLSAVTRHHLSVALDVVRPTTTTIDEIMRKCALRTKVVIGRHAPAVAVEGIISQLSSTKIDVIGILGDGFSATSFGIDFRSDNMDLT
ncbi:hypothetical protein BU17DRAFT_62274 [Hysterangium stoloniferum]|nr:hypothetical protein BU17DRAFT_62274 [Hysterangium stoloniferum]